MATTLKTKRRTPGSKGKTKSSIRKKETVAPKRVSVASPARRTLSRVLVRAATPALPIDPHPQYTKAVNFLMSHTDYEKMRVVRYNTTTFSLDRMRTLLRHLGNPHTRFKTAHVAGTKGKGSTCHMLAGMLQAGGLKTGLYTSPHIIDMRERIRINGDLISHDELVNLVKRVEPVLKKMAAGGGGAGDRPTFFEIFTAMSFCYFADRQVDIAVIETGMGGRLDSTNVITPEVTAITSISKDHMSVLGNTTTKIAEEKAGIFKKDIPAVTCIQDPDVTNVLKRVAGAARTALQVVGQDIEFSYRFEITRPIGPHMRVCLTTDTSRFEHLAVPLMGEHQAVNCGLALAMLDKLKQRGLAFDDSKALEGLATVKIPGRLEVVSKTPHVIIDGAHNAASVQALFRGIGQHIPYDSMVVIFGCNCDKDIDGMLEQISLGADKVIFTRSKNNPKSADPQELANLYTERYGKMAQVADSFPHAMEVAERAISREDLVTVTGSFYLVGEAKQFFLDRDATKKN
ncbi:MAG TPA: folylpolyglutamate synthase/dihydrofolate synthase family protein [Phycisphaerae bacterium]|nr:folylpolyglutamate synthase/dihydrofolate synthase family protein [Phycisphaerae bacterium]